MLNLDYLLQNYDKGIHTLNYMLRITRDAERTLRLRGKEGGAKRAKKF